MFGNVKNILLSFRPVITDVLINAATFALGVAVGQIAARVGIPKERLHSALNDGAKHGQKSIGFDKRNHNDDDGVNDDNDDDDKGNDDDNDAAQLDDVKELIAPAPEFKEKTRRGNRKTQETN